MARKRVFKRGYFDVADILRHFKNLAYYIIYGERRSGKTYSTKKLLIESVAQGYQFVYMRRLHRHITKPKAMKFFEDIQDYAIELLGSYIYYESQTGFYILVDGERKVVGHIACVEDAYINKGVPYPNIKYILFDEFIDYTYMKNEIELFQHAIANYYSEEIADRIQVIMLGNTINKFSPYFDLFSLDTNKIKQGKSYYFESTEGVNGVVHWTATRVHTENEFLNRKKKNRLLGFGNETSEMTMYGEWEYKHCNTKSLDGISWNCNKHIIPLYVTALDVIYELAIYTDSSLPILFIRDVNTQEGKVSTLIKYNLSFDNSQPLTNKYGFVPTINKINDLVDKGTIEKWNLAIKCIECGRVLFNSISVGSNFITVLNDIRKNSVL